MVSLLHLSGLWSGGPTPLAQDYIKVSGFYPWSPRGGLLLGKVSQEDLVSSSALLPPGRCQSWWEVRARQGEADETTDSMHGVDDTVEPPHLKTYYVTSHVFIIV